MELAIARDAKVMKVIVSIEPDRFSYAHGTYAIADANHAYVTHNQWTSAPSAQLTYPTGRQISSGHDLLYRRNSVTETSGGSSIANWQFFGARIALVSLGNGLVCSNMNNARTRSAIQYGQSTPSWGSISTDQLGYDGAARPIGKRYFNGGSVMVGFTSAYDKSGNKLFERALHAENRSSLYDSYDSMNRLLDYERGTLASGGGSIATSISLPGTNQEQAYNLDGLGNWSTTTITPEGGSPSTQSRTHNKLNEVTLFGSTAVYYDQGNNFGTPPRKGSGNIIDEGTRLFAYDAFNRLTTVWRKSDGAVIGQYRYDAHGRRVQKTVSNGGLGGAIANGTTNYLYDGDQCIEEQITAGSTTRQFIWGQYIDELIQMRTYVSTGSQPLAAGIYYLLSDLLYRSTALTNASGSIVEAYDTDAYGNTLIYSGPGTDGLWFTDDDVTSLQPACEYVFTGRQYDPESQIYFYRARYYHPYLGRFISRDPAGYQGSLSLYLFAHSNPLFFLDPSGRSVTISGNGITADIGFDLSIFGVELAGFKINASGSFSVGLTTLPKNKCKTPSMLHIRTTTPRITVNRQKVTLSLAIGLSQGPAIANLVIGIGFPHWYVMTVQLGGTETITELVWSPTCGCIRAAISLNLKGEQNINGPLAVAALAVAFVAPEVDLGAAAATFVAEVGALGAEIAGAVIARLLLQPAF